MANNSLYQSLLGGNPASAVPQLSAPAAPPPGGSVAGPDLALHQALGAIPTMPEQSPDNLQLGPMVADNTKVNPDLISRFSGNISKPSPAPKELTREEKYNAVREQNSRNFNK